MAVDTIIFLSGCVDVVHHIGADEQGRLFQPDEDFAAEVYPKGVDHVLETVCGLDLSDPAEAAQAQRVRLAHDFLADRGRRETNWLAGFHVQGFDVFRN